MKNYKILGIIISTIAMIIAYYYYDWILVIIILLAILGNEIYNIKE